MCSSRQFTSKDLEKTSEQPTISEKTASNLECGAGIDKNPPKPESSGQNSGGGSGPVGSGRVEEAVSSNGKAEAGSTTVLSGKRRTPETSVIEEPTLEPPTKKLNISVKSSLRNAFMELVDELLLYLRNCKITKECSNADGNLGAYRDFEIIISNLLNHRAEFETNPEGTIELWIKQFAFQRFHFDNEEWDQIQLLGKTIYAFAKKWVFPKLSKIVV